MTTYCIQYLSTGPHKTGVTLLFTKKNIETAFLTNILLNVKCMCWCLSIIELNNAR